MNIEGYEVERVPMLDFDGTLVALVVLKKTWTIGEDRVLRPSSDPDPIRYAPVLEEGDDPMASPVKFESDMALVKPKADLVVLGEAVAPSGSPTPTFDVEVRLGDFRRTLRIFGPRRAIYRKPARETKKEVVYTPPLFTDPVPVSRVPMSHTHSYGGKARYRVPGSDEVIEIPCPCNPFGKGYCVQNSPEGLDGLELPQIEDPEDLLTPETIVRELGAPEKLPMAAGFGFFGSGWYPRVSYVGVMPYEVERTKEQIREQAKKLDPEKDAAAIEMLLNFEPPVMAKEFYQAASPKMAIPYPRGDEPMVVKNMTPSGHLAFNLPGKRPFVRLDVGDGLKVVPMALDTVVLDIETSRLILTFRGRIGIADPSGADSLASAPIEVREVESVEYERLLAS